MTAPPPRGTLAPGVEIDGFVIEAVAGRGGMGVVYRARQRSPDRVVALKVIAADLADEATFRARFRREWHIAAQIEHPNVIPVYAVGEAAGVLYIAMRFVSGTDLRTLLAEQGRIDPTRAAAIADTVAQALDAAHAHGLVHRDVKPANILLSQVRGRDHIYLADFGLSRHIEGSSAGLTGTGTFLGTIDYVAPEQARGEPVDARTDVYSLGCVLFQALTGTVPFPLDNDLAKLYAHDRTPPPSALQRASDLPAVFETVLARAMAKSPEERYLSAGDLGRAAVAAAAGQSLSRSEHSVAAGAAAPLDARAVPAARGESAPPGSTVPSVPPEQAANTALAVPSSPTVRAADEGTADGTAPAVPSSPTVRAPREAAEPPEANARGAPAAAKHRSRRAPGPRSVAAVVGVVALAAGGVVALVAGGDEEPGAGVSRRSAVIPASNLMSNPSFESGTSGWDSFRSEIARVPATDAPDGGHVARVTLAGSSGEYAIDDDPDTVGASVRGRSYAAVAWVRATPSTEGEPVCIAIRERQAESDESEGFAAASVTATAAEYRPVRVRHIADGDGNRVDVHLFRGARDTGEGDAFLVDAITMTEDDADSAQSPPCPD